jgi:membrane associated rhomboid family serine protease
VAGAVSAPNDAPLLRRLKVLWYRLFHGLTPTQAEFRVSQAERAGPAAGPNTRGPAPVDRFHCVCGQLLIAGDRTCGACGRWQLLPFPVRRIGRALRSLLPGEHPAAVLVLGLIVLGYALQWRTGSGSLFRPGGTLANLDLGASVPALTLGPQPWRAVTYAFLHGGLMHLVMNLVTLVQIAPLIEGYFGSARFLAGWVLTGAAGVILPPLVLGPQVAVTLGASGAVCGLIGMAWIAARQHPGPGALAVRRTMERWMIYTTVLGLALEFGAGVRVAHGAHFGGALAGVAFGWLVPPPMKPGQRRATPWVGLLGAMGLVAGLWGLVAWQMAGRPIPEAGGAFASAWSVAREMAAKHGPP